MEFPNIPTLKSDAVLALRRGRQPRQAALAFAGLLTVVALGRTVLSFWLGQQMGNAGGLSNLGTRTMLSTVQSMLPLVQMVVLLSLELGYVHAMMRISRGQYADHTDLKVGFRKFFPLLRLTLMQALVYFSIGFLTYQVAMVLYLFTPWADGMMDLILPLAQQGMVDPMAMMTEEFLNQAAPMVMPMLLIWAVLFLGLMIPVSYRLRFSNYALLDDSRGSAFAAIRTSLQMTRRNCIPLFKLDLSFWWYYLLSVLVSLLAYLDSLLPMLGIRLPINSTLAFFLCYCVHLAATFAMVYFLRNGVECTYLMAYESLREKPQNDGVVLGNIFDM